MFSEKLNFLMDITKTTNSTIATVANMDPSYISRLRRGNRKLPKDQNYVIQIAKFFARNITNDFQKNTICNTLNIPNIPNDQNEFTEILYRWLLESAPKTDGTAPQNKPNQLYQSIKPDNQLYFGNLGKRYAVIRFLTNVLNEETPQTLLLFSDEDMTWMIEDPAFNKQWSYLLTNILKRKNRIKIIHSLNRTVDEMITAIVKWVPVYLSGLIEAYYYPKLRDKIFKRTLFIAPKTSAILSNSIKDNTNNMLNIYLTSPEAINALTIEFNNYLALCNPLMQINNFKNVNSFFDNYHNYFIEGKPSVLLSPTPSLFTMPKDVAISISNRYNSPLFFKTWTKTQEYFSQNKSLTEIIGLNQNEKIEIPLSEIFSKEQMYYTKEEYKKHLINIYLIMKEKPNYTFIIDKNYILPTILWTKEDLKTILIHSKSQATCYSFSEQQMNSAFWIYLNNQKELLQKNTREKILESLNNLIKNF